MVRTDYQNGPSQQRLELGVALSGLEHVHQRAEGFEVGAGSLGQRRPVVGVEPAAQHWQDEVARQFDADHWTPLAQRSRAYLAALRTLMDVLETAERDTEF